MSGPIEEQIRRGWEFLGSGGETLARTYRYYALDTSTDAGNALLAFDSQGLRHLLLPVSGGTPVREDRKSRGVQIRALTLEEGEEVFYFVDVICNLPHLNELFTTLVSEMLQAMEDGDRPSSACSKVLNEWRELLERPPTHPLSREEQVGLFGELLALWDLVAANPHALETWTGPSGSRHDFRNGNLGLEVKATLGRKGRCCEIHGADQLQAPPEGELFFCFIRLEEAEEGRSITDLMSEIKNMVEDNSLLLRKVAETGYREEDAEIYSRHRFQLIERFFYRVDEDFPRITPDQFRSGSTPPGVVDLRYEIELANHPPFPMAEGEVQTLITQLSDLSDATS